MSGFRSGFVAVVGRPNVGKSTLVNAMVGTKVTITSPRPNTTRSQVRGRAQPPRRPGGVRGHPRPAQAPHRAGRADERVGHLVPRRRRRGGGHGRGHRRGRARRPDGARPSRPSGCGRWPGPPASTPSSTAVGGRDDGRAGAGDPTLLVVVNKIDRVGGDGMLDPPDRGVRGGRRTRRRGRGRRRARSSTSRCRRPPARGCRPWSTRWSTGCPRAPATTPRGWSPTWPRPSGWPTWSARSCSTGWRTSSPTASPAGSPSGSGRGSGARSWSSATRRRASSSARAAPPSRRWARRCGPRCRPGAYLELFVRVEKRWQQREDALDRLGF